MPGNVAVHGPKPRVIKCPRNDEMAVRRHRGHVAARRIRELPADGRPIPLLVGSREHEEVVAVEMDGVGDTVQRRLAGDVGHGILSMCTYSATGVWSSMTRTAHSVSLLWVWELAFET